MNECPICRNNVDKTEQQEKDSLYINCIKCGTYEIDGLENITLFNNNDLDNYFSKISSWISEQNKIYKIEYPLISRKIINKIIVQKDKTIKEKFDCFMKIVQNLDVGKIVIKNFNHCYIKDETEFGLIFQKALDKNLLQGEISKVIGELPVVRYSGITFDGLEYIESLSQTNKNSKNIFVAFYFNDEMQQIFDNDIKKAIEDIGFNYVRVSSSTTDTDKHINDDIIGKIKSSKIVIADFTGQRNSVYFEAGFAMGLKRPVIWSCQSEDFNNLSFDTRQYPHIKWDNKDDFVDKLKKRILAII